MKIKQLLQTIQTMTQPVTQRGQSCPASGLVVRTGVRAGTEVKESGSLQLPISVPILANDPNPDQFAPFAELKVMP